MTTKEITITATSGGYVGGNKAQISVDGTEIGFGNYSRGINAAVFDETTGKPLFSTSFDTPIGAGDSFADFINGLPAGRIVALAVQGDAETLADVAKTACQALGSDQIDSLSPYQSYALIGIKGHDPGTAQESISWQETSISYTLEVEVVKDAGTFTVEAISKPSTMGADYSVTGGNAQIKVNGNPLTVEGGYQSGWNLVVLDRKDGQVKTSGSFNPWIPSEVEKFVQTIQDLQAGEIVAIATKDYAGTNVEAKVKKACSSIGATMVGKLGYGGNWAIVGYQGAKPGKAVESLAPYSPPNCAPQGVEVKYWSGAIVPLDKQLKPGQKLSETGASEKFSCWQSTGIDGDYAAIGDPIKGNAYMYHWQNGQWQLQQQLQPQGQNGQEYGVSVDASGNWAIVGQRYADASGKNNCGAAHIYQLKGGQWQHWQILQPSDLKAGDEFGISVAIDGKVAIVSACLADAPGKTNCGAAYVFQLEGDKWVQKAKLQPDDLGTGDCFATCLSIDGNVLIVGAAHADANGKSDCGAAYIFHLENGKWVQQKKLQPLDLGANDLFGHSVAIASNRAIVAACTADVSDKKDAGAAYIYQLQDGEWQLHQKILASNPNSSSNFGYSVGIGNDVALVGARYADDNGKADCGAVYLFQLVNNKWEQKQKLQPSDLPAYGQLGDSLDFDGSRAIVGSYGGKLTPKTGFAYICDVATEE